MWKIRNDVLNLKGIVVEVLKINYDFIVWIWNFCDCYIGFDVWVKFKLNFVNS